MDRLYLIMLAVAASAIVRPAFELTIVNNSAPHANFVFSADMSSLIFGGGFLQSRVFQGQPGTPAEGTWLYEHRLDLRNAQSVTNAPYTTSVGIRTGPVAAEQVFVVSTGGLDTIGLQSASGLFGYNTFQFTSPVWAGDTSDFWSYVSSAPPQVATATVATSNGNIQLDAYAPHW